MARKTFTVREIAACPRWESPKADELRAEHANEPLWWRRAVDRQRMSLGYLPLFSDKPWQRSSKQREAVAAG